MHNIKKQVATLSILSNSVIIILKFLAGFLCGSISIISEAIHSLSDLCASVLTFFSVIKSSEPADKDHPFGHGKYEDLSGFVEGCLIIFAALFIVVEAVKKAVNPAEIFDTLPAIIVMAISCILNIFVSSILMKTAKKTNSLALLADGEHLRSDIYSSLGVFIGLIIIKVTGFAILDSIIAILVAFIIFNTGMDVTKAAMNNLVDSSIPQMEIEKIEKIIKNPKYTEILGYKNLKTRRLGPSIGIEITLIFPQNMTIYQAHKICDEVEIELTKTFGNNVSSSIHLEPESVKEYVSIK